MNQNMNHYTVNMLFSEDLSRMLLVRKNRTLFQGMLNGPGGSVEPGEQPYDGALREILEETGLDQSDFRSLGAVRLAGLGELAIPNDCKANDGSGCVLHYYAGAVKKTSEHKIRPAGEALEWRPTDEAVRSGTDSPEYAGKGDLAYFAAAGLRTLKLFMPEEKYPCGDAQACLTEAISAARGRLDACFRRGDMFQASLEAADVSKMSYAAWYAKANGLERPRKEPDNDG